MIRFIEVVNETDFNPRMEHTATPRFSMGEVWINEAYVAKIREATGYRALLLEGCMGDLDKKHEFTAITTYNGALTETHVVVGAVSDVASRLDRNRKTLLKG